MNFTSILKATTVFLTAFLINPIPLNAEPKSFVTLNGQNYSCTVTTEKGVFLYSTEGETIPAYIVDAIDKAHITNDMDDLKKAKKISQYLSDILTYDNSIAKFTEENYIQFTDWCITTGDAVCAGYADSFQKILTHLGIECYYEVGHTYDSEGNEDEYHAWNRVVIDGHNYWYDVCWYDTSGNPMYIQSEIRWDDRIMEEEWFRYRINGSNYPN